MLDPFSSRFVIIKVEKYSFEEFKQVAMKVLNQVLECGSNSSMMLWLSWHYITIRFL